MIRHAKLKGNHKHVIARQIYPFDRANLLDHATLEKADDLPAVIEVAGKSVKLPCKDCVCIATLDPAQHLVEDFSPRFLCALAFSERLDNRQTILHRNRVHFRKLRVNRERLAVFILTRFAAVNEILKHGHSISNDIYNCETKMKAKTTFSPTKEALALLRGDSTEGRVTHRLHSVTLVLNGLSASEAGRMYGDSPRAVAYWVERFKERGVDGLYDEERPGRRSRLSPDQLKKVQTFLKRSRAASKPITGDTLSLYLLHEFKISLTPRQCWRILKQLKA